MGLHTYRFKGRRAICLDTHNHLYKLVLECKIYGLLFNPYPRMEFCFYRLNPHSIQMMAPTLASNHYCIQRVPTQLSGYQYIQRQLRSHFPCGHQMVNTVKHILDWLQKHRFKPLLTGHNMQGVQKKTTVSLILIHLPQTKQHQQEQQKHKQQQQMQQQHQQNH